VITALGVLLGLFGGLVTASPALAAGRGPNRSGPQRALAVDASFCGLKVLWDAPVTKAFIKILKMLD
jgi:hypothetical protein